MSNTKIVEGGFSVATAGKDITINLGVKPLFVIIVPNTPMFSVGGSYAAPQLPCAILRGSSMQYYTLVSLSNSTQRLGYITDNGFVIETQQQTSYLGGALNYIAFIEED